MIVIKKPTSWLGLLLRYKGTALRRIWRRLLFTVVVSAVITYLDMGSEIVVFGFHMGHLVFHDDLTPLPFTLIGAALGIFLGFRNNTSYDRFWEGRKLWGRMVNTSRTLTRQVLTLIGPVPDEFGGRLTDGHRNVYRDSSDDVARAHFDEEDAEELIAFHREMVRRIVAYVHSFRLHLRGEEDWALLSKFLNPDEVEALRSESNRPVAILQTLGDRFREAWLRGWVHSQHLPVLEASLTEMTNIQGGCERIKSTPIPFSYTALIHRIVAIYCYALPFGILNATKEFTPIVVMFIAYAFFGLDAVGDEIEDPFGSDHNDLPLTALSTMIEVNIRQRIGEEDLPEILKPVDEVLM